MQYDFTKIQQNLLTIPKGYSSWRHAMLDDKHIISEGHVVYFINDDDWLLDTSKLFTSNDSHLCNTITEILKCEKKAKELTDLKTTIESEWNSKSKSKLFKLENGDEYITLDVKQLKSFPKYNHLKGTSYKEPVYVYHFETLVGIIMPTEIRSKLTHILRNK